MDNFDFSVANVSSTSIGFKQPAAIFSCPHFKNCSRSSLAKDIKLPMAALTIQYEQRNMLILFLQ